MSFQDKFLGIAYVDVRRVQPHRLQRPLDEVFVEELVSSLLTSHKNRHEKQISVCLTDPANQELLEVFASPTSHPYLDLDVCGIDGQHRGASLIRLNDLWGPENKDYTWLAKVYSHEVYEDRSVGLWMANQNSTSTAKGSMMADYIRALSVYSKAERDDVISFVNGSKDQQALRLLSNSVLWDIIVEMTRFPLYSALTQTIVLEWRKLPNTALDFLRIVLEDMVHQKNYIESEIRSSGDPEFVLTVQQILGDAASNQLKSGEAGNLQVCYRRGNCSVLEIIKNNRFPTLTGNVLWESLMKWVGTRVAEEPGEESREYVFGGMIPLLQDFKRERFLHSHLMLMNMVMVQAFIFSGGSEGNLRQSWAASIEADPVVRPLGSILPQVLHYIATNIKYLADAQTLADASIEEGWVKARRWYTFEVRETHIQAWRVLETMVGRAGLRFNHVRWTNSLKRPKSKDRTPLEKISNKEAITDKKDYLDASEDVLTDYSDASGAGKKRKRKGKGKSKASKGDDAGYVPPKAKKAKTTSAIESSLTKAHIDVEEELVNSIQQSVEETVTPPEITRPGEPTDESVPEDEQQLSVPGENPPSEDGSEDLGEYSKDYGKGFAGPPTLPSPSPFAGTNAAQPSSTVEKPSRDDSINEISRENLSTLSSPSPFTNTNPAQPSSTVEQPSEGASRNEISRDILLNQSGVTTDSESASRITADNVAKDTTTELGEISTDDKDEETQNIDRIQNDDEENEVNSKEDLDSDSEEGDEEEVNSLKEKLVEALRKLETRVSSMDLDRCQDLYSYITDLL